MKIFFGLLAALTVMTVAAHAASDAESALEMAQASYPKCTLGCLAKLIPQSNCSLTDVNCLCTNVPLNANLTLCVVDSCTTYESLITKNVSSTMCGAPVRNQTLKPLLIGVIGGAIALMIFILRLCSALPVAGRLMGWDDYAMCIAVALGVPPTVFSVLLSKNGLGKDMWTLPLSNIENVLFYYYLGEIFYFASLTATKISLLAFFLRVFPQKAFRQIIYVVIGICITYGFSFVLATTFQCSPVPYSWKQLDDNYKGSCNNIHIQGWMSAIFNIVIDLIILVLPLKELFALQTSLRKKLMVMVMFSLGIFVTFVSVVRLRSLIVFANSQNITWDYNDAAWWSTVEIHVGIICACLPSVRALFVSLGASSLGTTRANSRPTGHQASNNSGLTGSSLGGSKLGALVKEKPVSVPKHGDEEDFIPLVDMGNSKA
ncbi:CFEM domain-containing protein, partial [Aureobasidium melanogenum]